MDESEGGESFGKVAKRAALDIIGGAIKDIAKGQVKEAAKQIIELGKDLGPIIVKTAAYAFFRSVKNNRDFAKHIRKRPANKFGG